MKKITIFIITLVIISLVAYLVYTNYKKEPEKCDIDSEYAIKGEIISISNNEFLLKTSEGETVQVHYNKSTRLKTGQNVEIIYDGVINDSLPPQVSAMCVQVL